MHRHKGGASRQVSCSEVHTHGCVRVQHRLRQLHGVTAFILLLMPAHLHVCVHQIIKQAKN